MVAGHFATALLAKQQAPKGHIAFYLVIAQLPDLLWFVLHFLGLEPTSPANPMDATLQNMAVDMTYSHDLLPTFAWTFLAAVAGRALFKSWRPAAAAGLLIVVHAVCDALSGHAHYLFGPDSPQLALGLYKTSPFVAITLDGLFTLAVIAWLIRADARASVRRSRQTYVVWAAVLGGGVIMLLPNATRSLADTLGIAPLEALSGALIPGLVATYLSMLVALVWADSRPNERTAVSP